MCTQAERWELEIAEWLSIGAASQDRLRLIDEEIECPGLGKLITQAERLKVRVGWGTPTFDGEEVPGLYLAPIIAPPVVILNKDLFNLVRRMKTPLFLDVLSHELCHVLVGPDEELCRDRQARLYGHEAWYQECERDYQAFRAEQDLKTVGGPE